MLIYIAKTVACMGILFFFYKLFLERESIHVFKRFYLLFVLGFSLIVPALVFTEYVEVISTSEIVFSENQPALITERPLGTPEALETDALDIELILWCIYLIGFTFLGLKFIKNLYQISGRIRKNPKQKVSRFTNVLLKEIIPPHTFFNYIFLNQKKYESRKIPKEVLLHEQTHARQKHSIDVVLMELLQVLFWFNPFVYFLKKSVKLNHEFLADEAVLKNNIDKTTYQNTLLSYLSPDSEKKYQPLANAINYSSIKKRFTIMKRNTSKKAVLLRSLILLPLLALLVYGFSQQTVEKRFSRDQTSLIIKDIVVDIDSKGNLSLDGNRTTLNDIGKETQQLISNYTKGERKNYITTHIIYDENHLENIEKIQTELLKAGLQNINHVSKKTSNILSRPTFIPSKYHDKTIEEARAIQKEASAWYESIWFDIKNENEIWYEDRLIAIGDLAGTIVQISNDLSEVSNIKVQFYATGLLRSGFVDKLNIEARKANAKEVQVFTEEYIINENEYHDEIELSPGILKLKTNKMTLVQNTETIVININKKGELLVQEDLVSLNQLQEFLSKTNAHLTKEQKQQFVKTIIRVDSEAPKNVIDKVNQIVTDYGSATIDIKRINHKWKPSKINGASNKQLSEYNSLAKKYNTMLSKSRSIQIKLKDVNRLEYIYGLMSKKQKAIAEPFPDFPEPPAPPKSPRVLKGELSDIPPPAPNHEEMEEIQELKEELEIREQEVLLQKEEARLVAQEILMMKEEAKLEQQEILLEQQEAKLEKIEEELQRQKLIEREILEPPVPPNPKSPLDHVIEMAKKNARFYHEGKEISSDSAIALMKKNKDLNIDSRSPNGKRPVVKLSTKPIMMQN